jgi:hypothetical protein
MKRSCGRSSRNASFPAETGSTSAEVKRKMSNYNLRTRKRQRTRIDVSERIRIIR